MVGHMRNALKDMASDSLEVLQLLETSMAHTGANGSDFVVVSKSTVLAWVSMLKNTVREQERAIEVLDEHLRVVAAA